MVTAATGKAPSRYGCDQREDTLAPRTFVLNIGWTIHDLCVYLCNSLPFFHVRLFYPPVLTLSFLGFLVSRHTFLHCAYACRISIFLEYIYHLRNIHFEFDKIRSRGCCVIRLGRHVLPLYIYR